MFRRPVIVAASVVAVLTGCSSDPDNTLTFESTTVASTVTTTTEAATTTTAVAPTSTTVAVTTTLPATTTTEDIEAIKAQVEADYRSGAEARTRCDYDPAACDFAAIAVPGSPQDVSNRDLMKIRLDSNLRAVEGRGEYRYSIEDVEIVGDSVALVTVCAYDSIVIYDIANPAEASDDLVFDDQRISNRARWELHLEGSGWRIFSGVQLTIQQGDGLCVL
jgi:hypothetical protein